MSPKFSVVIPAHNDPLLIEAVQSVLAQTLRELELVVVDDGSTPAVRDLPDDPRIKTVRHEIARGPAGARNSGLAVCTAPLVAFLDSDDLYHPHRLQVAFDVHEAGADVVVARRFGRWRRRPGRVRLVANPRRLTRSTLPAVGVTSLRRTICARFDEEYFACEDIEWWIRLIEGLIDIRLVDAEVWQWRRTSRERVLHGPSARLRFSYRLLEDHSGYFESDRCSREFRWRRIAMMERYSLELRRATRALCNAFISCPKPAQLFELYRLVSSSIRSRHHGRT